MITSMPCHDQRVDRVNQYQEDPRDELYPGYPDQYYIRITLKSLENRWRSICSQGPLSRSTKSSSHAWWLFSLGGVSLLQTEALVWYWEQHCNEGWSNQDVEHLLLRWDGVPSNTGGRSYPHPDGETHPSSNLQHQRSFWLNGQEQDACLAGVRESSWARVDQGALGQQPACMMGWTPTQHPLRSSPIQAQPKPKLCRHDYTINTWAVNTTLWPVWNWREHPQKNGWLTPPSPWMKVLPQI